MDGFDEWEGFNDGRRWKMIYKRGLNNGRKWRRIYRQVFSVIPIKKQYFKDNVLLYF